MGHSEYDPVAKERRPWNAGRKLGAKRALKAQQVWAIRFWLDRERRLRDRAMFDLAIDSKLRGCDIVKIKIGNLVSGGRIRSRAIVVQQKTGRPVQFELLEPARGSLLAWFECRRGTLDDYASRAGLTMPIISARGSMPGSLTNGSLGSDCAARTTAPFTPPDESVYHLQADGKPARRADFARPYEDREHGPLPRRRYRGCPRSG
jgi:hypothetical protein